MSRSFNRLITTPAAARAARHGSPPYVSLLSDFGLRDPSAGICRAVVLGIAPEAIVMDISHEVDKFQVRDGALLLWSALPFVPIGSHVAVVDPGVGTERRAIAIETGRGDMLVGPDNGLLLPGADRVGGIKRVHLLENPEYRLPSMSSSFHGRDLFAPAAAHLALGVPIEAFGRRVDPTTLVELDWPVPSVESGVLEVSIVYIDTFGNVKLGAARGDLFDALGPLSFGVPLSAEIESSRGPMRTLDLPWLETFGRAEPRTTLLYEDSYGRLAIAENQGSAEVRHRLREGMTLRIRRADSRQAAASDGA